MSVSDYYSYLRIEDEDSSIFYQFITKNNIAYTVYFKIDEYTDLVKEFPLLLQKGYAFGFRKQKFSGDAKNHYDEMIFATIYQIGLDFFNATGKETVLLYHCDHSDDRQFYRNRLFEIWETKISPVNAISKHSVEVQIGEKDFFLGFITLSNNPLIAEIKEEFEAFSYFIIQPKN